MNQICHTDEKPLVSVIVPVFNRSAIIGKTLDSVKKQTHRPIELIIVDDGSTDDTLQNIRAWAEDNQESQFFVRCHTQKNSGAPAARNAGIRFSTGRYLQFLDSDDTLEAEKIAFQVNALETSGVDLAVCDFRYVYKDSTKNKIIKNDGDLRRKISKGWSVSISTPLIQKKLIADLVWWNKKLDRQQDVDFLFKVFCLSSQYTYTPEVWCNYIHHDSAQISDQYKIKAPQFIRRIKSLGEFSVKAGKQFSFDRHMMLFSGILTLFKQLVFYWPKRIIKALTPKSALNAILEIKNGV